MTTKVPPRGQTTLGIDVSHFQVNTDWDEVSKNGVKFAFIKATDGISWTNACFEHDMTYSKINGIIRGPYHFFRPDKGARVQAEHFLSLIGDYDFELPVVLDWEPTETTWSATVQLQGAIRFLELVESRLGRTPILYSSPAFMNSMGNPLSLARYPLWISHYGVTVPSIPTPWTDWKFWQYSESGKVPGIQSMAVDLDCFNGSLEELLAFARPPQVATK